MYLITGASGMLGSALIDIFSSKLNIIAVSRRCGYKAQSVHWHLADINDIQELKKCLIKYKPFCVIHCAAMVNVDECESDYNQAYRLHVEVTKKIAQILNNWGGHLVYVSTDSVFDGAIQGCYKEDDMASPLNVYAKTKFEGEYAAQYCNKHTIVRTNIFGWSQGKRLSFVEWIIKALVEEVPLNMFTDMHYTPVHVSHFATVMYKIVKQKVCGLFHVAGADVVSKYDFAMHLASVFDLSGNMIFKSSIEHCDLKAIRPKNMSLDSSKIEETLNIKMPSVVTGMNLLKWQYQSGWLEKIKAVSIGNSYKFWEESDVKV